MYLFNSFILILGAFCAPIRLDAKQVEESAEASRTSPVTRIPVNFNEAPRQTLLIQTRNRDPGRESRREVDKAANAHQPSRSERDAHSDDYVEKLVRSQLDLGASHWNRSISVLNHSESEDSTKAIKSLEHNSSFPGDRSSEWVYDAQGLHRNHNYDSASSIKDNYASYTNLYQAFQTPDPMSASSDASVDYGTIQQSDDSSHISLHQMTTPQSRLNFFEQPKYMYRFRGPISGNNRHFHESKASSSRYLSVAPQIAQTFKRLDELRASSYLNPSYSTKSKKNMASELNSEGLIDVVAPAGLAQTELDSTDTNVTEVDQTDETSPISYELEEPPTTTTTTTTTTTRPRPNKLPASYKLSRTKIGNKTARNSTYLTSSQGTRPPPKPPTPLRETQVTTMPSRNTLTFNFETKQTPKPTSHKMVTPKPETTTARPILRLSTLRSKIVTFRDRATSNQETQQQFITTTPLSSTFIPITSASVRYSLSPSTQIAMIPTNSPASIPATRLTSDSLSNAEMGKHAHHHHIHSHIHRIKPAIINFPYHVAVKQPKLNSYESIMAAAAAAAAAAATASATRQKVFPLPERSSISSSSTDLIRFYRLPNGRFVSKTLPIGSKLVARKPNKPTHNIGSIQSKIEKKIKQLSSSNGTLKQTLSSLISSSRIQKDSKTSQLDKKSASRDQTMESAELLTMEPIVHGGLDEAFNEEDILIRQPDQWPSQQQLLGSSPLASYLASMIANVRPPIGSLSHPLQVAAKTNQSLNPALDQKPPSADNDLLFNPILDHSSNVHFDGANSKANQYEWNQLLNLNEFDQPATSVISSIDESNKEENQGFHYSYSSNEVKSKSNPKNSTGNKDFQPSASVDHQQFGHDMPMQYALSHYIYEPAQYLASLDGTETIGEKANYRQQEKHGASKPLLEIYDDSEAKFSAPHVEHADLMTTHEYDGFKPIIPRKYPNNTYFFDYPPEKNQHKSVVLNPGDFGAPLETVSRPKRNRPRKPNQPVNGSPSQVHLKVKVPNQKQLKAYGHHVPPGHTIEQIIYPSDLIQQALLQAAGSLKPHLDGASSMISEQKKQLLESGHLLMNPHDDLAPLASSKHSKSVGQHSHKHIIHGIVPLVLIIIPVMIMIAVLTQLAIMIPIIVTVINIFVIPIVVNALRPARSRQDSNYDLQKLLFWPFPVPERLANRNETSSTRCRDKRSLEVSRHQTDLDDFFRSLGAKFESFVY